MKKIKMVDFNQWFRKRLKNPQFRSAYKQTNDDLLDKLILDCVNAVTVSEWFKDCCEQAQVMDFTFHCLRHTFASYMLSRGVPIYKVSKILGHSGVVVTEQHYGHLDRSVLTEEIKHIEGVMTLPKVSALQLGS